MGKYEKAISDCESALSINPKCSKTIEQKGNVLMRLGRFEEARTSFESLRPLGESALADTCLKKLDDIQEKVDTVQIHCVSYKIYLDTKLIFLIFHPFKSTQNQFKHHAQTRRQIRKNRKRIKSKNATSSFSGSTLALHCS